MTGATNFADVRRLIASRTGAGKKRLRCVLRKRFIYLFDSGQTLWRHRSPKNRKKHAADTIRKCSPRFWAVRQQWELHDNLIPQRTGLANDRPQSKSASLGAGKLELSRARKPPHKRSISKS